MTESLLPSLDGVITSVCRAADHLRAQGHDAVILAPRSRDATPERYAGFRVALIRRVHSWADLTLAPSTAALAVSRLIGHHEEVARSRTLVAA